jgi:hypothetical protein
MEPVPLAALWAVWQFVHEWSCIQLHGQLDSWLEVFLMAVLWPVWQLVSLVVMPANNNSLTVGSRVVLQSYETRSIGSFVGSLAVCS